MSDGTMWWQGKLLKTYGDVTDALAGLSSAEEAVDFMRQYRAVQPHADTNVGYLTGYFGAADAQRLRQWCGVQHPIFGSTTPTVQEALTAGQLLATKPERKN